MDKFYGFYVCLVILIINIYVMVLIENLLVIGISTPLLSDLHLRHLASYLVYATEGVVGI